MNQSVSALGSVVRATRKSKNLSQEALAEKLGVCKRTIIDIEKNTGNPKFELLCMLVRELDLPLYEVFLSRDGRLFRSEECAYERAERLLRV